MSGPTDKTDIVERLRNRETRWKGSQCFDGGELFKTAADEIERLRTARDALAKAKGEPT